MPFEVGEPPTRLCRNLTQLRDELFLTMVPLYSPRKKWAPKTSVSPVSGYGEQCRKQPPTPFPGTQVEDVKLSSTASKVSPEFEIMGYKSL